MPLCEGATPVFDQLVAELAAGDAEFELEDALARLGQRRPPRNDPRSRAPRADPRTKPRADPRAGAPRDDPRTGATGACAEPDPIDEPRRQGACVQDREGFRWMRGRRLWTCSERNGSERVTWSTLGRRYGPLSVNALTDAAEDGYRARRGWPALHDR